MWVVHILLNHHEGRGFPNDYVRRIEELSEFIFPVPCILVPEAQNGTARVCDRRDMVVVNRTKYCVLYDVQVKNGI